ncbi:MAG: lytic transglycosylase domain-containing protein [Proteobacteria bacterium]|nr:lytic transglycosylase domain-containing protein [Pseudomonadota bacterium]
MSGHSSIQRRNFEPGVCAEPKQRERRSRVPATAAASLRASTWLRDRSTGQRLSWCLAALLCGCTGSSAYPAPISAPHHGPQSVALDPEAELPPPWNQADVARIRYVQAIVRRAADRHGVEPSLVNGVIWVESRFQHKARGRRGPRGLMQIMPSTGKALARQLDRDYDPYDPDFNIDAGTYYLSTLLKRFDGREHLALAAYNRGPGRVGQRLRDGLPMPEHARRYVRRVLGAMRAFQQRPL